MKIIKGDWNEKIDEVMAAQYEPFIFINSNGSKWAGQEPDDIGELYDVLSKYALRPDLEEYGNFINENPCRGVYNPKYRTFPNEPQWIDGPRLFDVEGVIHFSGNFLELSHIFSIYTNDAETIRKLTNAIRNNQKRDDYLKNRKTA